MASAEKKSIVFDTEDYIFIIILVIFSFLNFDIISQFKQLPGPIYGGDLYYHLGMMNHFRRGGSIFKNSQFLDEVPWAPFIYQLSVVVFSKLTGLDLISANLYSSFIFMILSFFVIYILSQKIFGDKMLSLIPVLFFALGFPVFKYSFVGQYLIIPFFLFSFLLALEKQTIKHYFFAGLCYGLIGINHTTGFMVVTVFVFVVLFYLYVIRFLVVCLVAGDDGSLRIKACVHSIEAKKYLIESWKKILVFLVVGFLLAQLYWFQPIFVFHLQTPNTISEYDQAEISRMDGYYTLNVIKSFFFNFDFSSSTNVYNSFVTLLMDVGIISLAADKKREFKHNYLLLIVVAHILATLHYLFTVPLFGREFFSRLMGPYLYTTIRPLFFCFGFISAINLLHLQKHQKKVTVACIILILLSVTQILQQRWAEDKWFETGRSELPSYLGDVSDWVKANTNVNDVFISTNEISFMLNGLTGNKVMNSRRAHSGMFVDVDRRWADSAVILYGNNSRLRSDLIKKYKIKYLYWQYNWIQLDYMTNEEGKLVGWFDPFLIKDINNYEKYLKSNGVKYFKTKTWLDPANRFKEDIKQFDVLFVLPSRADPEKPWHPSLDSNLTLVKEFTQDGYPVARIYRIS